jgi:hypothetical protein
VLAALFAVLLPVAVTGAWVRGSVLSTSGYVAAVTPLAANPVVRAAVRSAAVSEVDSVLSRAAGSLPPAAAVLAGPLGDGLASLAGDAVSEFMASTAFGDLWVAVNRTAHSQLVSVLNGDNAAVAVTGGEVVLNLAPLIADVLSSVSGRISALTGEPVALPKLSGVPAADCRTIARLTRTALRPDCEQIPLSAASALTGAQRAFRILSAGTLALMIGVPLVGAAALLASSSRRRTLLWMGLGGALMAGTAAVLMMWVESVLAAWAQPPYQAAVTAVVHTLLCGFLTLTVWSAAGCLILAAAALLPAGRLRRGAPGDPGTVRRSA